MQEVARVVVALEATDVAEEVMHFLDRSGGARVVGTAADDRQLIEAVRQLEPDAVVAHPSLVEPAAMHGPAVLALDTRESVSSLRAAIRVGARGFYLWPGERDALAGATAATVTATDVGEKRAVVDHGPRRARRRRVHVRHDPPRAGARPARARLRADRRRPDVRGRLRGARRARRRAHDRRSVAAGVRARVPRTSATRCGCTRRASACSPHRVPSAPRRCRVSALERIVRVAASSCDAVVVSLPRQLGELTIAALEVADRALEVLSLDVLSFRSATRAMEVFAPLGDRRTRASSW